MWAAAAGPEDKIAPPPLGRVRPRGQRAMNHAARWASCAEAVGDAGAAWRRRSILTRFAGGVRPGAAARPNSPTRRSRRGRTVSCGRAGCPQASTRCSEIRTSGRRAQPRCGGRVTIDSARGAGASTWQDPSGSQRCRPLLTGRRGRGEPAARPVRAATGGLVQGVNDVGSGGVGRVRHGKPALRLTSNRPVGHPSFRPAGPPSACQGSRSRRPGIVALIAPGPPRQATLSNPRSRRPSSGARRSDPWGRGGLLSVSCAAIRANGACPVIGMGCRRRPLRPATARPPRTRGANAPVASGINARFGVRPWRPHATMASSWATSAVLDLGPRVWRRGDAGRAVRRPKPRQAATAPGGNSWSSSMLAIDCPRGGEKRRRRPLPGSVGGRAGLARRSRFGQVFVPERRRRQANVSAAVQRGERGSVGAASGNVRRAGRP